MNYCQRCGGRLEPKAVEGINRIRCENAKCGFVHWDNPVPVVAALVQHLGNYVIARNAKWPKGIFSLVSGFLERGETPEQAVVREVAEELGLTSQVMRHIGNYSFVEKNQLILCYEVAASGTIKTNHELAELKQLSPTQLAEYDFGPLYITKKIVKDWVALNARSA
jgi:NADH pyrophosphatase NudC (nudix superfamily)